MVMHETEAYQLTLPAFEGPLDLLLHLIEREERRGRSRLRV